MKNIKKIIKRLKTYIFLYLYYYKNIFGIIFYEIDLIYI